MAEPALTGLRVVEWGSSIATAYCGRLFADLGAEVVKVEPPAGDRLRRLGPFPNDSPDPECSGLFVYFHGGKKSVVLDLDGDGWRPRLARLLDRVDVLVEDRNIEPEPWPALEKSWLMERFPRLVHVLITPFGETGPYAGYKGNALTAWAISGLMYATGTPDREPLANGTDPADYFAGQQALLAALAALEGRESTGLGDHADVSLAESMVAADDYTADIYAAAGAIRRRFYARHLMGFPAEIMACKDGYITYMPGAQMDFPTATALLVDQPDLMTHPLLADSRLRQIHQEEFLELIRPWLSEHTVAETLDKGQTLGLALAPVSTMQDLAENEHLKARHVIRTVQRDGCTIPVLAPPVEFSGTPVAPPRSAPVLGAEMNAAPAGEE